MENKDQKQQKSKKKKYGTYLIITAILASFFSNMQQNIQPHSLTPLLAFLVAALGMFINILIVIFMIAWINDLIKRRRNNQKNN